MATPPTDDEIEKAFSDVCDELKERNYVDIEEKMRDSDRKVRHFLRDVFDESIGAYMKNHPSEHWWDEPLFQRFTYAHADLIVFRAWQAANKDDDQGTRMPSEEEFREAKKRVFAWRKDRYCGNLAPREAGAAVTKDASVRMKVLGGICPTG